MRLPEKQQVLRASALGGFICSALFSLAALILYTLHTPSQFGTLAALALTVIALSLPLWSLGVLYGLTAEDLLVTQRYVRPLFSLALFAVVSLLVGQLLVILSQRTIGNLSYGVGAIALLCTTAVLLSTTPRDSHHW